MLNELALNADKIIRALDQESVSSLLNGSCRDSAIKRKHEIESARDSLVKLSIAIDRVLGDNVTPAASPFTPSKLLKSPTMYPLSISPVRKCRLPGKRVLARVKPLLSSKPALETLPHIGLPVPASPKPYKQCPGVEKAVLVPTTFTPVETATAKPKQCEPVKTAPIKPKQCKKNVHPILETKQTEKPVPKNSNPEIASKRTGKIFSNSRQPFTFAGDRSVKRNSQNSVKPIAKLKKVSNYGDRTCPNRSISTVKPANRFASRTHIYDQSLRNRGPFTPKPKPQAVPFTPKPKPPVVPPKPRKPTVREAITGNQTLGPRVNKPPKPAKPMLMKPPVCPKEQGTPKQAPDIRPRSSNDKLRANIQNLIPPPVLQDIDEISFVLGDSSIANSTGYYDISNIDYVAKWLAVPESEKEAWVRRNKVCIPGHIFGEVAPINMNQIFPV